MKNSHLKKGLYDGCGKPQPLALKKSKEKAIIQEKHIQSSFIAWRNMFKHDFPLLNSIVAVPNGICAMSKAAASPQVRQGLTSGIVFLF